METPTYKHLVGKTIYCIRSKNSDGHLRNNLKYKVVAVLGDTVQLAGVGVKMWWSIDRFVMGSGSKIPSDQMLADQAKSEDRTDETQERLDAQDHLINMLATRLDDHINVPSWWNKRVDRRLKAIEEEVFSDTVMIEVPTTFAESWAKIEKAPGGWQFLIDGAKKALKDESND